MSFMLRKACRMRASSPDNSMLVFGSMPRMPATNTKSPARVPRLQVPVGLMAPSGASVLTPFGDGDCAMAVPPIDIAMPSAAKASFNIFSSARSAASRVGRAGLQRECVERAAHLPAQCLVDQLVLLHQRLAAERGGDHGRRIMV